MFVRYIIDTLSAPRPAAAHPFPSVPLSSSTAQLRALLNRQFPDAIPVPQRTTEPVALGVPGLERAFPAGGLPRGRLTGWMPQGGAMAILRATCLALLSTGERAAWVDGGGTIGPFWTDGPLLVRPAGRINALRWSEGLLRCGGFALVVLAGIEPQGTEAVRLSRAVHEGGGAFVTLTTSAVMAAVRVTSRVLPHSYEWQRGPFPDPAVVRTAAVDVHVRAPGWNARAQVVLPITPYDLRLSLDPALVDRRGVER